MTTQTHVATSDPFGIVSTFPARFHRAATSTINIDVISERIGLVLRAWDKFAAPVIDPAAQQVTEQAAAGVVDAPVVRPYPQSTVEAVEYLVDLLQISHDAVLRGTRVSERTFYGWKKNPTAKPRQASLGRLWPTVEALSYLAGAHPNLAAWFHATPQAQEAFQSSDLDRLLQLEIEWVTANAADLGLRNATAAAVQAPAFGDPGDSLDEPEDEPEDEPDDEGVARGTALTSRSRQLSPTSLRSRRMTVND